MLRLFSIQFRRARQALRKYEKDASDARVWELAREIVNYVRARQLRAELRSRNQKLVPSGRKFNFRLPLWKSLSGRSGYAFWSDKAHG
jgi:hypothetical protein